MTRLDQRARDELRPVTIERGVFGAAAGSVLISTGMTKVWCSASVESKVPAWMEGQGRGWMTAEYCMLPGSTHPRSPRDRQKSDGRTTEIQRLIGRSLRAIADLEALGERTIVVDCDVLQADGGTRTASITGALVAVVDALRSLEDPRFRARYPLRTSVAAVSVGMVQQACVLDLPYVEDVAAEVDMNVVMTGRGEYVEIQGTGEEATFTDQQLGELLCLAHGGLAKLRRAQRETLGSDWPFEEPPG
ncbi:MAG TPA: ribonuclease PH [Pirellulaceae bacterium]